MLLNGPEVRQRAARLAPAPTTRQPRRLGRHAGVHLEWLAERVGVSVGTIHNATRPTNPQPVSDPLAITIARELRLDNETLDDALAAVVQVDDEPVPVAS